MVQTSGAHAAGRWRPRYQRPGHCYRPGGGPTFQAVFCLAEAFGTALIYATEYNQGDDTWSDPVDAVAQAQGPLPELETGISVVCWLETVEHGHNDIETRVVSSLCYVTLPRATREQEVVVLVKRYGRRAGPWQLRGTARPAAQGGLKVHRMGRSNGPHHCAKSLGGLPLIIAGDQADLVCVADRGGFPYGWRYDPRGPWGDAEPKRLRPNEVGQFDGDREIPTGREGA